MTNYAELDPGIRDIVRMLNDAGLATTDSGDGVSKSPEWYECGEAMPFPHVVVVTTPDAMVDDAERCAELLGPEWIVEAEYRAVSRHAHLFARTKFDAEKS